MSGGLGPRRRSARARPSPPPPGWFAIPRPRLLEPARPRRCRLLSDRAFMTLLEPRQQRSPMRRVSLAPAMRPLLRLRLPARPRCPRQLRARTPRRPLRRRLCRPPRQTRRRPMYPTRSPRRRQLLGSSLKLRPRDHTLSYLTITTLERTTRPTASGLPAAIAAR